MPPLLSSWTSITYFRRARRVDNNLPNDAVQPNNDTQQSQAMNRTSESSFEVGQAGGDQQAEPINSNDRCKFLSHCGRLLLYELSICCWLVTNIIWFSIHVFYLETEWVAIIEAFCPSLTPKVLYAQPLLGKQCHLGLGLTQNFKWRQVYQIMYLCSVSL